MFQTLSFIAHHPVTRKRAASAMLRWAAWQVGSRLKSEHIHNWVDGTKLVVTSGMTGATGNIYCGLHEFADMGFLLHLLRPGDLFLDIGANIGSYTVLASGVRGARTVAFEPDPEVAAHLRRNLIENELNELVEVCECALGEADGEVRFTVGMDTINHVATANDEQATRTVPMRSLDLIESCLKPTMIKLDVEGYESQVLSGAQNVLASPSLLAVETETANDGVELALARAGLERRWYDPRTRTLANQPFPELAASNALYVRDDVAVRERVRAAPIIRLLGLEF